MKHRVFTLLPYFALLLLSCFLFPKEENAAKLPLPPTKAHLVLVGGGDTPKEARERFIYLAGGKNAHIVLIPTASSLPDCVNRSMANWKGESISSLDYVHTYSVQEANSDEVAKKIKRATGVWVGGGDQWQLCKVYRGTKVEMEIKKMLVRGGVLGGTSAGASCVSSVMVWGDTHHSGFGILPKYVVDQHFNTRGRIGRLTLIIESYPDLIGLGIDESTALIIEGDNMSVYGEGNVSVCRHGSKPNIKRKGDGQWVMGD